MRKNIYITLDYELFMSGDTGTVAKCLVEPMNELVSMLDKYDAKVVVFVDAAYLLRLSELQENNSSLKKDFEEVKNHIKKMHGLGHDIEMHFHPQWLYSSFKEDKWIMDTVHYKMSDMQEDFLLSSFAKSKELLEKIINRKVYAFRAGGYCLTSYEKYIELFKQTGLKIDSSVLPGNKLNNGHHNYDYSSLGDNISSYKFSHSVLEKEKKGDFIEFPISTMKMLGVKYYLLKNKLRKDVGMTKIFGDGKPLVKNTSFINKIIKLFSYMYIPASLDFMMVGLLPKFFQHLKKTKDIVVIAHPKNFSDKSVSSLEQFLNVYGDNITIKTFL